MRCQALRNGLQWVLIGVALVLGGCGSLGAPKNAEEYRQATRDGLKYGMGAIGISIETFEVERPFREVSSTLQRKADECLKVAVHWSATNSYGNTRSGVHKYKPTFVNGSSRAELHIQRSRSGGGDIDANAPPGGFYKAVLDATPVGKSRTRIEIYTQSKDDDLLRRALREWAQGSNLGCPDLGKR
jgi:hypothetical protein